MNAEDVNGKCSEERSIRLKEDSLFTTEGVTQSNRCLHTPNIFARQNLLYVQEVGQLKSLTPHQSTREGLDSFLFLCVTGGSGSLEVGAKHYEIKKGDCALINCMQHYSHISSILDSWELAWVHFNGVSAQAYFDLFYQTNQEENVVFHAGVEQWLGIITSLMEKQNNKSIMAELESGELLLHMLNLLVGALIQKNDPEEDSDIVLCREIREILNEEYTDPLLINSLTNRYDMTMDILDYKFGKQFGIGVQDYIINRRFNAAKELLRFTILPMEEVLNKSGIEDMDDMQQLFREKENMSPDEYRSKWAQWIK
jgi:AraC-like DNA-binding protein